MKKTIDLIKMFLCFAALAVLSVGCSNTAILAGSDNTGIITQVNDYSSDDGYVLVTLQLPENVGRGWDIASYNVKATRGDDVEEFTSKTSSLNVRLKVGTWYFSANAVDKYGNILYSAGSTATVGLNSAKVYIGLLKRVGQVQVSMKADNIVSGAAKPQRYEVTAERGDDFIDVTGDVHSIEDTVTLTGLAQGKWTLTCTAYSAPSDNPTGDATVPYYSGTAEVEVTAGSTSYTEVVLDALKVAPPTFSHSGQVKAGQIVTISSQQSGAKVYATTGQGDPSQGICDGIPANPYSITVNANMTVKAAAYIDGIGYSEVVTKDFTVVAADKCVAPQIKPESQTIIGNGYYCTITCEEKGAAIYYTTDGTAPTTSSTLYNGKFAIDKEMTVKAIAMKAGLTNSDVVSVSYGYKALRCAAPTIDPIGGTFAPGQVITISRNTTGSTTYYRISDKESEVAAAEDNDTKSFDNNKIDIDTALFKAGTYYITAFSRIDGRDDSVMTKAAVTISETNKDDNVIYMCIDNLIVTTKDDNIYKEVGTMPSNNSVWYGFTCDAGGNVYVDVEPSTVSAELYKNGQKDEAKISLKNNIASLPSGDNYFYLKLTASSLSSNVRLRVYTTTKIGGKTLESLEIKADPQSVQVGKTLDLTAIAHYSDDTSLSDNIVPVWTVSDTSTATVSGNTLTGVKKGIVKLTASYTEDGVSKQSNELTITVTPAANVKTLEGLSVTAGGTISAPVFTAAAVYSDGSTKDVTQSAVWISETTSAATISKGTVTLKAAGSSKITCSYTESGKTVKGAEYTVTVTAVGGGSGVIDKLYLKPSSNWMNDSARFAAYFFNNNTSSNEWVSMTAANGQTGLYVVNKPSTAYANVIFCRMNPGTADNNWNNKWNQTGDLAIPADKDTFQPGEGVWDNATVSWLSDLSGSYGGGDVTLTASVEQTGDDPTPTTTTTSIPHNEGLYIYVKSGSAPTLWAWENNGGLALSETGLGETWPGEKMVAATGMNDPVDWYMKDFSSLSLTGKGTIQIHLDGGNAIDSGKKGTFWYDGNDFLDADPTKPRDPVKPTVTLSPTTGSTVKTTGALSVTFTNGYSTITSAKVTVDGTEYNMGTVEGTWTKSMADLGITADGKSFTVTAVVTNSVGTTTATASYTSKFVEYKDDPFTWDNVNAYFVLTDRFYNGDHNNDHSYGRSNHSSNSNVPDVATFHGGDLAGLTAKLDYFVNLGVNAIWITAPYEQVHGWVGGKNGAFPHYAYHGYYTLDWSAMDQNMGTVEEYRTFINACHSKGIRVIMDVVMNHVGYNNLADMITYKHGSTTVTDATWIGKTDNQWVANIGVDWSNDKWETWWGPFIRSFAYDEGSEYGGSCGGLPDVKTELKNSVGLPPVLKKKWNEVDTSSVKSQYYNPSVASVDWNGWSGDYRTDKGVAPAVYQEVWLSAWVRELGIDGFRCDTAKHVEPYRWGELKVACQAALEAWRNDTSKSKKYNGIDTGASDWDENFWMTGECFGWTSTSGQGDYYTTGKFDSMINFSFNGSAGSGTSSSYPNQSTWSSYLNINNNADSDGNGNRNNVLTYISSHDTKLCRAGNQAEVGTMLQLTPGGIQIYYGDENSRDLDYTDCGDTDMMTRGDMNFNQNTDCIAHWGKVGRFRKYNPAVGAGTGSATKRSYSGSAGDNKVAIGISSGSVDVSGLWNDGTTVYNWYDGQTATVSGGKVSFTGGSTTQPILVSEKNPADYN